MKMKKRQSTLNSLFVNNQFSVNNYTHRYNNMLLNNLKSVKNGINDSIYYTRKKDYLKSVSFSSENNLYPISFTHSNKRNQRHFAPHYPFKIPIRNKLSNNGLFTNYYRQGSINNAHSVNEEQNIHFFKDINYYPWENHNNMEYYEKKRIIPNYYTNSHVNENINLPLIDEYSNSQVNNHILGLHTYKNLNLHLPSDLSVHILKKIKAYNTTIPHILCNFSPFILIISIIYVNKTKLNLTWQLYLISCYIAQKYHYEQNKHFRVSEYEIIKFLQISKKRLHSLENRMCREVGWEYIVEEKEFIQVLETMIY